MKILLIAFLVFIVVLGVSRISKAQAAKEAAAAAAMYDATMKAGKDSAQDTGRPADIDEEESEEAPEPDQPVAHDDGDEPPKVDAPDEE